MAYLSLYRKHRPQTFDDILGQEHVSRTLANAIDEGRVAHAYLFTGPRGTGKTSTARILAKALNCERGPTPRPCGVCPPCRAIVEGSSMDVIELDAASHSSVDSTREILAGVPLATAGGRRKVYVIDEVHMLTTQSFNALLKTLEEPPEHVVFVLATTEAHKVLPTIISRTQRFDFRRVPHDLVESHLAKIAKEEGIEVEEGALEVVARHADGGVRDALSVLDQLSNMGGPISVADVERLLGGRSEDVFTEIFDGIAAHDVAAVFQKVDGLASQGADMRQTALGALDHARSLLLLRTAPDAESLLDVSEGDRSRLAVQAESLSEETLVRLLDLLSRALTEMRNSPAHRLLLEVALVRAAAPETDPGASGLLGRIERLERRVGIDAGDGTPAPAAAPATARPAPERGRVEEQATPTPIAPAAETASPSPPSPQPAHPGVSLAQVRDAWQATPKEVSSRSKRVWGLLSPSRPARLDADGLVVEVQSGFHRDEMAASGNRTALADALDAALGIRPDLHFVERGAAPGTAAEAAGVEPGPAGDAPPERDADGAAAETAGTDPVELLKEGLGAEVVEEHAREE